VSDNGTFSPYSKGRIEALSDGVFAIAMTLLALEIKVPELPRTATTGEILHALKDHGPILFAFFVTFMLAGQFWLWHHAAFHYTRRADRFIALLNIISLMFVSLLPFTTAMLGSFTLRQPLTLALYFANQLTLGLLLNAHWWYASWKGLLTVEPSDPTAVRFRITMGVQPFACLAAIAAIAIGPSLAFDVFVLVQVASVVIARKRADRVRRRRVGVEAA
jgi:uncharacterized membrane protein